MPLHPRFLNSVYCYPSVEGEAVPLPFGLEDVAGIPSPNDALNVRSPLALKITAGFEGLFGTVMLDSGLVFFFWRRVSQPRCGLLARSGFGVG